MRKELRNNQSLINLSTANSTNTSLCGPQQGHHLIVRRKVGALATNQRRRRSGPEILTIAVKYIPLARVVTQDNSISLPISRQNSKENLRDETVDHSTRRFQRHSERIYPKITSPDASHQQESCKQDVCLEEKNGLSQNIRKITLKNQRLEQDNQRLLEQIQAGQEKNRKIQDQLREKNARIEELRALLAKKDAACSKMHESITQKYRQITKLEDIVCKLQKQILSSSNPQPFTPLSLESTRIINHLSSQLKYREIQNHMLKKEQFDTYALEEQIKTLSKENAMLKDRLTYYIRMNNNIDAQSCSSDSFSLSFSETSPLKRSGRLRMDGL